MPRIAVAVPVYNGASLIAEALSDLSGQTYKDFTVTVYDNASTDDTNALAMRASEIDPRIRVVRRPSLVPAIENFKGALADADCDYFMWRAYDDLSAPNYIAALAAALDAAPDAGLAVGAVHTLKPRKSAVPRVREVPAAVSSGVAGILYLTNIAPAAWIYGLFRRDRLQREFARAADALPQGWATDHAALFPYLLDRAVAFAPETHFVQRIIKDPNKTRWMVPSAASQWQVRKAFHDYCTERIRERDFSAAERLALRAALPRLAGLRTFRFNQMLTALVRGE